MDPHRNSALNNAKFQSILQSLNNTSRPSNEAEMPAPPAYHTVVDPNDPIPNVRNPYDPEEEDDKDDEDVPDITINAATQVRGNGNIISIAQMDSARIAHLIAIVLHGGKMPEPTSPSQTTQAQTLPSLASLVAEPKPSRSFPKINITVNCGATILGDRNIVGPGLGDIARQMQVAQRTQAMQAQQQAVQNQRTTSTVANQSQRPSSAAPSRETLYQAQAAIAQHHGLFTGQNPPTPPMSRSASLQSEGASGLKRKAENGAGDGSVKKQC